VFTGQQEHILSHMFAAEMPCFHAQEPIDYGHRILAADQIESMVHNVAQCRHHSCAGPHAPSHEPPMAQHCPCCTTQRRGHSMKPVIYRRPGDDLSDAAFPARGPNRPIPAHRDTDQRRRLNLEVVEHRLDWLLPIVIEDETL
jgi:hypothetical protein